MHFAYAPFPASFQHVSGHREPGKRTSDTVEAGQIEPDGGGVGDGSHTYLSPKYTFNAPSYTLSHFVLHFQHKLFRHGALRRSAG